MELFRLFQCLLVLGSLSYISGARILAILPLGAKSHHYFHQGVLKALAHRGHEVVVYGPLPQASPIPNYKDVYVNTSFNEDFLSYDQLLEVLKTQQVVGMAPWWNIMTTYTEEMLKNDNIQKLAKSKEKFDVVIVEAFIVQEAMLIFGHIFNAPIIVFQPFGTFSLVNKVMGNSLALPTIPEFHFPFSNQMSLYERIINSYGILRTLYFYYTQQVTVQQSLLDRYLNIPDAPSVAELINNISLVFTNAHQLVSHPQPLTPNIIPLGGIHLSKERQPLPKAMQTFLDEADTGFVYFSLGTCVPDHRMPEEFYQMFLRVFKSLKQRVLWKTRRGNITNIPKNVMITKWAPQQDVLAHSNIKLFITHGGLLSLLEVTQAGVPVVGVPFFADQPMDVIFYVTRGVGVKLDFFSLTDETISTAINTVLSNPKYKENAVKLSKVFNNMPMSQQDLAVYWTEHVLAHGGAHHLKPPSAHMSWYQLMLIDVVVTILAAIFVMAVMVYLVCKAVFRWLTSIKKSSDTKKCN